MLEENFTEASMQKQPARLWIVVLVLGWLFDFLFWKHALGIQFFIFAALTLAAGFVLLKVDGLRPARTTLILVPFVLFFGAVTFFRAEGMTLFLGYALTLFLMAGVAVTYSGGRWFRYSVPDYLAKAAQLVGSVISLGGIFWSESRHISNGESDDSGKKSRSIWPVVRGLFFAVPVLAFFAALLASADVIFASRLQDFIELFRLENLPEYIFRGIYIGLLSYALAGVFLHAARKSADEKLLGLEKPLLPPFFGFTEASIVLGSLVALFSLFVGIQFQYFFGGQSNIHIDGYTYAEYARRGFGELVSVAFFSLLLFLGLSGIVKRENETQHRVFSGLGVALTVLVGVMLFSAFQRLVLYESAYGFTRLRTYTHVFIIWLGLLLAVTVVLDVIRKQRWFAFAALVAALGFAMSLSILNVDAFIARSNIERAQQGEDLDIGYLAELSTDATPILVRLYQSQGLDKAIRIKVGAALSCKLNFGRTPDADWRAFSLSRFWAERALDPLKAKIESEYTISSDRSNEVTAPDGETYSCYSYTYD